MNQWKVWTLLNPKRILGYNVRNITGDADPVLAAAPEVFREVPAAARELASYLRSNLSLSHEMRLARDLGVTSSGFFTSEVSEIGDLPVFSRLRKPGGGLLKDVANPAKAYLGAVQPIVNFREDLLRYAAFKHYRKRLAAGGPVNFGASRVEVVRQLRKDMGDDVAAAHLARNLLGDYGNMTAAGEWARKNLIPFWAFQEINLKRYPRLAVNALLSGAGRGRAGAVIAAAATMRVAGLYSMLWTFNNLVMSALTGNDDEKDLPAYDRANPHILLGRNPDGTVRVFRNVGSLGDFLEWFGLNEALSMLRKYHAGQIEASDIVKEMAKSPLEKFVGGLRPDIKGGFEVLTGQSLFPSPFAPRAVDRGEAAANVFGLSEEYKWVKGLALGSGDAVRRNYWQRWFVGVIDPRSAALGEIYDLRGRYLAKKGSPEKGTFPVSQYKAAREAAINEDYNSFVAWKKQFESRHPGADGKRRFLRFLKGLDPIASRLSDRDEREFVREYLSSEQREKLRVVRDYAAELRDRLVVWWEAANRSGNTPVR